jgi:hypothetical protein
MIDWRKTISATDRVSVLVSFRLIRASVGITPLAIGRPDQSPDSPRDVSPDRIGDVLVSRRHRCTCPSHDPHHRTFGHAEYQQHGRRGMPSVVQATVSETGVAKQALPLVIVSVGVERTSGLGGKYPVAAGPQLTSVRTFAILYGLCDASSFTSASGRRSVRRPSTSPWRSPSASAMAHRALLRRFDASLKSALPRRRRWAGSPSRLRAVAVREERDCESDSPRRTASFNAARIVRWAW